MGKVAKVVCLIGCLLANSLHAAQPIKIGIAGPYSGPNASFGEQMWEGAKQAADDINAKGGILGRHIELIKGDDACEPKQAVTVANRLVNLEEVTAIVGHFCSSSTIPASNIYDDAQALMITPASTSPLVTDRGLNTIFRVCGRDDQQGTIAADFITKKLKSKGVAVIHDKDTYGKGLADATKAQLNTLGTKVVLYEGLTRGEKDFSALVTKIKESRADTVYFGGLHPEAGPLLRQLSDQIDTINFVSGDGIVSTELITTAGGPEAIEGVYMTFSADPRKSPQARKIVQQFRDKGFEPEGYTLYTYATLQIIAKAMEQTRTTKGDKLAEWLHEHKVNTVIGQRAWDKQGDLNRSDYLIYQWDDKGHYHPVYDPHV